MSILDVTGYVAEIPHEEIHPEPEPPVGDVCYAVMRIVEKRFAGLEARLEELEKRLAEDRQSHREG